MIDGSKREFMQMKDVRSFLDSVLDEDIHTKRIDSLANATLGVMTGASLGVAVIGKSLAQARGLLPKHAVKQVDRLLSNPRIEAWDVFATWVPEMVGPRKDIVVAMDWTDFDADGQATLALKLVTRHGRATPLIWLSVHKDELTNARNAYEDAAVRRLAEVLSNDVKVTILAGFADTKLFGFLDELGFDYVIRLKGNTKVSAADGLTRPAAEWVGQGGRARKLRDAAVTAAQCPVGAVVCVHAKGMKEAWCLATSNAAAPSRQIIDLYSKRWSVEPSFRDTKDLRFGMGLSSARISDPQRRCCCSMPLPSFCSPGSAPPARASAWTATSSPTPSRPAPIPCSARAACSTT
jgi:Transposase DDE domain